MVGSFGERIKEGLIVPVIQFIKQPRYGFVAGLFFFFLEAEVPLNPEDYSRLLLRCN